MILHVVSVGSSGDSDGSNSRRSRPSSFDIDMAPASATATAGDRTAEFQTICEAITLGIPLKEYIGRRRKRKADRLSSSSGHDGTGDGANGGGAAEPAVVALNFLGDLLPDAGNTAPRHRDDNDEDNQHVDPWLDNARRLEESIRQMSDVLQRQEGQYVDLFGSIRNAVRDRDGGGDSIMTDDERNSLDAAVASFAVSTGNQIEALRQALLDDNDSNNNDEHGGGGGGGGNIAAHRVGIVACLVSSLRSDVVDRMGRMHAVRMRPSLDLARDPLRCRLPGRCGGGVGNNNNNHDDDGRDDDGIMAMMDAGGLEGILQNVYDAATSATSTASANVPSWNEAARAEEEEFHAAYGQDGEEALVAELATPPPSFPRADGPPAYNDINMAEDDVAAGRGGGTDSRPPSGDSTGPGTTSSNDDGFEQEDALSRRPPERQRPTTNDRLTTQRPYPPAMAVAAVDQATQEYYGESTAEQEAYIEDLQRESAYLAASLQNELQDVHKIENQMFEITTLLRQFGDLVSEQQEDVIAIHDQAERSKKNVQAGQDRLVDAGERKKKSKHYMATFVVCMALLLLFLNSITP